MTKQTCATCEFGDGTRCHWPYYANSDVDAWDATTDAMPEWAMDQIERHSGERVTERECLHCDAFQERDEPEPAKPERCPNTAELPFTGEAP